MIRVYASSAPELVELATLIAMYSNSQCHFDLKELTLEERLFQLDYYLEEFKRRVG